MSKHSLRKYTQEFKEQAAILACTPNWRDQGSESTGGACVEYPWMEKEEGISESGPDRESRSERRSPAPSKRKRGVEKSELDGPKMAAALFS